MRLMNCIHPQFSLLCLSSDGLTLVRYSILPMLKWTNSDSFPAICFIYENEFDPNVNALCAFDFLEYFQLRLQKKKTLARLNKGKLIINAWLKQSTIGIFSLELKNGLVGFSTSEMTHVSEWVYRCRCWDTLLKLALCSFESEKGLPGCILYSAFD